MMQKSLQLFQLSQNFLRALTLHEIRIDIGGANNGTLINHESSRNRQNPFRGIVVLRKIDSETFHDSPYSRRNIEEQIVLDRYQAVRIAKDLKFQPFLL